MKYTNKKTGVIAELVRENEKFKTVDLLKEDGTSTTISISTLKRWWKAIPEEETTKQESVKYVEASQAITEELNKNNSKSLKQMVDEQADEELCGDGTPLAQVGKEIAKQAKDKTKKANKPANSKNKPSKKDSTTNTTTKKKKAVKKGNNKVVDSDSIVSYVGEVLNAKGGTYSTRQGDGTKVIRCNIPEVKSCVAQFTFRKSTVCLSTKSKFLSDNMKGKFRKVNLAFDCRYSFSELNDDTKQFIDELINDILENSKKEEK